jgi:hypothetical protein
MAVEGPGVGIGDFSCPEGLFSFRSPTRNRVEFSFLPFPADALSHWNGPDAIPNDWDDGSLPASLPHDLITFWRAEIAYELNRSQAEIWTWANGILAAVWIGYGGNGSDVKAKAWTAFNVCQIFGGAYHWVKRQLGFSTLIVVAALVSAGCDSGCVTPPPPWKTTYADPVVWVEDGVVTTNAPPVNLQAE